MRAEKTSSTSSSSTATTPNRRCFWTSSSSRGRGQDRQRLDPVAEGRRMSDSEVEERSESDSESLREVRDRWLLEQNWDQHARIIRAQEQELRELLQLHWRTPTSPNTDEEAIAREGLQALREAEQSSSSESSTSSSDSSTVLELLLSTTVGVFLLLSVLIAQYRLLRVL